MLCCARTATPGGGFPLYGGAFAEVINQADKSLEIVPRNTKGGTENIPLLEAGDLEIALVTGEPAYEAFMGIGRPRTNLKIITAMYSIPGAQCRLRSLRDIPASKAARGASQTRRA